MASNKFYNNVLKKSATKLFNIAISSDVKNSGVRPPTMIGTSSSFWHIQLSGLLPISFPPNPASKGPWLYATPIFNSSTVKTWIICLAFETRRKNSYSAGYDSMTYIPLFSC